MAVQRLERSVCSQVPSFAVQDRIIGLRTVKRMGHLLDVEGRHAGTQRFCPW